MTVDVLTRAQRGTLARTAAARAAAARCCAGPSAEAAAASATVADDELAPLLARAVMQRARADHRLLARAPAAAGPALLDAGAPTPAAAPPAAPSAPVAGPTTRGPALTKAYAALEHAKTLGAKLGKVTGKTEEERGSGRDELVSAIKHAHELIDALKPADAGGADALASVRAVLYREAEHLAPYYVQGENADVLWKVESGKRSAAGSRTCNITAVAMTLEGLGKSPADYTLEDKALVPLIAARYGPALTKAEDWLTKDPDTLRLPDFLQLLAIAKFVKMDAESAAERPDAFTKDVTAAHTKAAHQITVSTWFPVLIEGWGLKSRKVNTFKDEPGWEVMIDRVGELNKGGVAADEKALVKKLNAVEKTAYDALPKAERKAHPKKHWTRETLEPEHRQKLRDAVVTYFNEDEPAKLKAKYDAAEKALESARAKLPAPAAPAADAAPKGKRQKAAKISPRVTAEVKRREHELKSAKAAWVDSESLAASGVNEAAGDPRALDEIIPIEDYAAIVSKALSAEIDAGNQVIGHLFHHFVRVEGVEKDGVRIDDPGSSTGKNHLFTWDEARSLGAFTTFNVISN